MKRSSLKQIKKLKRSDDLRRLTTAPKTKQALFLAGGSSIALSLVVGAAPRTRELGGVLSSLGSASFLILLSLQQRQSAWESAGISRKLKETNEQVGGIKNAFSHLDGLVGKSQEFSDLSNKLSQAIKTAIKTELNKNTSSSDTAVRLASEPSSSAEFTWRGRRIARAPYVLQPLLASGALKDLDSSDTLVYLGSDSNREDVVRAISWDSETKIDYYSIEDNSLRMRKALTLCTVLVVEIPEDGTHVSEISIDFGGLRSDAILYVLGHSEDGIAAIGQVNHSPSVRLLVEPDPDFAFARVLRIRRTA